MKFSVVVAAHNEGLQIAASLKRLREISQQGPLEILVADGGSDDDTVAQARDWADQIIVVNPADRGGQFRAAAEKASGDLLLFLRADAQPPGGWQRVLESFWLSERRRKTAATAFCVDYGLTGALRLAADCVNARARLSRLALWDHGLCTTPENYRESGGIPAQSPLADTVFCRRLGRLGPLAVLPERILCAARELRSQGILRCELRRAWQEARL